MKQEFMIILEKKIFTKIKLEKTNYIVALCSSDQSRRRSLPLFTNSPLFIVVSCKPLSSDRKSLTTQDKKFLLYQEIANCHNPHRNQLAQYIIAANFTN
ncbi:hypothetical protein PRUPE_2G166400 [Prunus persica]|uniref:Uncharacterized protein n=1 Tax=Prunus persica TaxID=3760 RepID=A0A251QGT1_PRUPE|nr:hypothetical protein PRUPE_2G166400 [Prunus persica]